VNAKFLLIGTLAATVTLYVWQVVSNVALPWHEATMHMWEGPTNDAVVKAVREAAPQNGVYFSGQGVLAAVSMRPDLADKTQMMGPMMAKQVGIDLVVAFLLTVLMARLGAMTPTRAAVTFGLAGLAAGLVTELANWNWYGYDLGFSLVNVAELTIMLGLAGLTLAWVYRRMSSALPELPGVVAQGGIGMDPGARIRR
jgi:hypothetical protein